MSSGVEPLGGNEIRRVELLWMGTLPLWQGLYHMRSKKSYLWTRKCPPPGPQPAPSSWTPQLSKALRNKFLISEHLRISSAQLSPLILFWKNAEALDIVWTPVSDVGIEGAALVTLWSWTSHLGLPHTLCQDFCVGLQASPWQAGWCMHTMEGMMAWTSWEIVPHLPALCRSLMNHHL